MNLGFPNNDNIIYHFPYYVNLSVQLAMSLLRYFEGNWGRTHFPDLPIPKILQLLLQFFLFNDMIILIGTNPFKKRGMIL